MQSVHFDRIGHLTNRLFQFEPTPPKSYPSSFHNAIFTLGQAITLLSLPLVFFITFYEVKSGKNRSKREDCLSPCPQPVR